MEGKKERRTEKKKKTEKKSRGKKKEKEFQCGNRTRDLLICSRHCTTTELPPQALIANCTYVRTIYRKFRF